MSGLDGINSLHKVLGGLQVEGSTNVKGSEQATGVRQAATAGSNTSLGATQDKASLSAAGGLASSQATDTSDVRQSKVAALQQAIASGSYNVPSSAVADKIVEGLLK